MAAATNTSGRRKNKKNRAAGEGCLYFDEKRRLWIFELMVGYRPDGKPDVRRVTARAQADCKAKADALREKAAKGLLTDADKARESLAGLLRTWLASVQPNLRMRTHTVYERYVDIHIIPALGDKKLSALKADDIQRFLNAKRTAPRARKVKDGTPPLSPRTLRHIYVVLNTALNWAVKHGYLALNPCTRVDAPRVPRVEVTPLTPEQTARLLRSAAEHGDPLLALWELAAMTGARKGELLALRWSDIDLAAGTLHIQRALATVKKGVPVFTPTKTARGRRVLDLAPDAVAALKAHRDRQAWHRQRLGEDYADGDLVFASEVGTVLDQGNVTRRFKRALRRAGLPETTKFHHLRHGAATMMLEAGEAVTTVAEYLGHSSPAVTLAVYSHVVPGAKRRAAERLAEALRAARTG